MRLAIVQIDTDERRPARNREVVERALETARERGADAAALPELWYSGYDLRRACADPSAPEVIEWARKQSEELGLTLFAGSLLERAGEYYYNAAFTFDQGAAVAHYRKAHLFGALGESDYLAAGDRLPEVTQVAGLRVATVICYDLRFPELFRGLAQNRADLILVPAQWPRVRIEHWSTLLRARAIECQCYVAGINRVGQYQPAVPVEAERVDDRPSPAGRSRDLKAKETRRSGPTTEPFVFGGRSQVYDPQGELVVNSGDSLGISIAELDSQKVADWRKSFPYLRDTRHDLV